MIVNIQRQPVRTLSPWSIASSAFAAVGGVAAGGDQDYPVDRSNGDDSRIRRGRGIRTVPDHRPGRAGDLPFPAEHLRDGVLSVAAPLSIVGTFGVMYLLGYSINNLTLFYGADDLHGICGGRCDRHDREHHPLHRGRRFPASGVLKGSEQIGFTIYIAERVADRGYLISLLFMGDVVVVPFLRIRGHAQRDDRPVSAIVSLTLTPMMRGLLLRHKPESEQGWLFHKSEQIYQSVIRFLRLHAAMGAAASVLHAAHRGRNARRHHLVVPDHSPARAFSPCRTRAKFSALPPAAQTVSFPEMSRDQQALANVILQDPAVDSLSSLSSASTARTPPLVTAGESRSISSPIEQRKISASVCDSALSQPALERVTGITLYT